MNGSKLTWVVFGLAVGAGAAWTFRSTEEQPKPPSVAATPVEEVAKEPKVRPVRAPAKKVRVEEKAVAEPVALKVAAPDVAVCGAHALVATEVIAHVRGKSGGQRVTVTATPQSEPLADCVREQVANARVQPVEGIQTFRYNFAPR